VSRGNWFGLGGDFVVYRLKNPYIGFRTQKNLKIAEHFDIHVLQRCTKFQAKRKRSKKVMVIQNLKSWRKFDKKYKKTSKFLVVFRVFSNGSTENCLLSVQWFNQKSTIGNGFGVQPENSFFFKFSRSAFFRLNSFYLTTFLVLVSDFFWYWWLGNR